MNLEPIRVSFDVDGGVQLAFPRLRTSQQILRRGKIQRKKCLINWNYRSLSKDCTQLKIHKSPHHSLPRRHALSIDSWTRRGRVIARVWHRLSEILVPSPYLRVKVSLVVRSRWHFWMLMTATITSEFESNPQPCSIRHHRRKRPLPAPTGGKEASDAGHCPTFNPSLGQLSLRFRPLVI